MKIIYFAARKANADEDWDKIREVKVAYGETERVARNRLRHKLCHSEQRSMFERFVGPLKIDAGQIVTRRLRIG